MVAWRWGEGGGGGGIGEWGGRLVVGTWRREQGGGSAASQWETGGGGRGMGGSGKGRRGRWFLWCYKGVWGGGIEEGGDKAPGLVWKMVYALKYNFLGHVNVFH